jgi:hypothetical protein
MDCAHTISLCSVNTAVDNEVDENICVACQEKPVSIKACAEKHRVMCDDCLTAWYRQCLTEGREGNCPICRGEILDSDKPEFRLPCGHTQAEHDARYGYETADQTREYVDRMYAIIAGYILFSRFREIARRLGGLGPQHHRDESFDTVQNPRVTFIESLRRSPLSLGAIFNTVDSSSDGVGIMGQLVDSSGVTTRQRVGRVGRGRRVGLESSNIAQALHDTSVYESYSGFTTPLNDMIGLVGGEHTPIIQSVGRIIRSSDHGPITADDDESYSRYTLRTPPSSNTFRAIREATFEGTRTPPLLFSRGTNIPIIIISRASLYPRQLYGTETVQSPPSIIRIHELYPTMSFDVLVMLWKRWLRYKRRQLRRLTSA